jgi:transposase
VRPMARETRGDLRSACSASRRKLRRYKRRWIVERTNAWQGQVRRLLVRHEYLLCTYHAFLYVASFWITLRKCF